MIKRRTFLLSSAAALLTSKVKAQFFTPVVVHPSPPPLDQVGKPAFAGYSVRKLRAAYSGKCMNVRSSGGGTQDIGFDDSGSLDLVGLLNFVGSNDGFITTWYDQVGSNNITQATTTKQPRIVGAGVVDRTPLDNTVAAFWGFGGNYSAGTTSVSLNKPSVSYGNGEEYVVFCNQYAGPGIPGTAGVPTLAADSLVADGGFTGSFQTLATDHQGTTPGSNPWPNDDNEPVQLNNLTATQSTFGTSTNIQMPYGGPNSQVYHTQFQPAMSGIIIGKTTADSASDAWQGYVMEYIIFNGTNLLSFADKARLFANQAAYYHIDTSRIADAVGEQMTAGYSTRKLRKGYAGFCLNVREDVGNTTQDIGFNSSGNLDTVALLNFVTGNGANPTANGFVTKWYDQSVWANVNNTTAVQATNANQPKIVLSGAVITQGSNNRPVLWFNQGVTGTINLQSSAGSSATSGTWAGAIVNYTGPNPGATSTFPTAVSTFTSVWAAAFQLANNTAFWQSGLAGSVNVNNTGSTTPVAGFEQVVILAGPQNAIAFGNQPGTSSTSWTGYIGEFVGFTSTLASGDQTILYNNQKGWWGTP